MKTAIIIPCYNEEKHIGELIKKLKKYKHKIIVIDDGSSDNTYEIAQKNKVDVLKHIVNFGKGAAVKTACDYAIQKKFDNIILMDGDGQNRSEDIPRILDTLKTSELVITYRVYDKNMPFVMYFGNRFINWLSALINGKKIKDTQSGFRAFKANIYGKIRWDSADYGLESEMIARAVKHKVAIKQIPIATIYHDSFKGTTIFDGIKIVANILKWKLTV